MRRFIKILGSKKRPFFVFSFLDKYLILSMMVLNGFLFVLYSHVAALVERLLHFVTFNLGCSLFRTPLCLINCPYILLFSLLILYFLKL